MMLGLPVPASKALLDHSPWTCQILLFENVTNGTRTTSWHLSAISSPVTSSHHPVPMRASVIASDSSCAVTEARVASAGECPVNVSFGLQPEMVSRTG